MRSKGMILSVCFPVDFQIGAYVWLLKPSCEAFQCLDSD